MYGFKDVWMYGCMHVGMDVCMYGCMHVCMCVCMHLLVQMLGAMLQCHPRTCTDPCCHVIGSFLVHAQTVDVTLQALLFHMRRRLMQRYKKLQNLLSYFHMLDATLRDLVLYVHRHFMLRAKTYSTRADT